MSPYVADPVYLNGQFLPLAEAGISPLDRGFLYGDGVYELIPVYSRRAFRIDEHLNRLAATLAGIKLANPLDIAGWKAVVEKLIADAPWDDQSIYLQVTRGADNKRDHAFSGNARTGDSLCLRRAAGHHAAGCPGARRQCDQRCRPALGALRPQGNFPAGQRAGSPASRRGWLR